MSNTIEKNPMYEMISSINAVEGFDPSQLAVQYEGLDGTPVTGIPVMAQMAWFRLKYPEGKIALRTEVSPKNDCIIAYARIYKHYGDPAENFLAEASASRSYSEKSPNVPPREWAQTAAVGIALRNAGFGLQFKIAGEAGTPCGNELSPNTAAAKANLPAAEAAAETVTEEIQPEPPKQEAQVDPLEAAMQTPCPLKRYAGRTLGELVMLDPGFLKWMATKYQNEEHPEVSAAAKLICEHSLKQTA